MTPLGYAKLWKRADVMEVLLRAGAVIEWKKLGFDMGGLEFEVLLLDGFKRDERIGILVAILQSCGISGREGEVGRLVGVLSDAETNEIGRLLRKYGAEVEGMSWEVTLENSPVWDLWTMGEGDS